ncbi:MAG: hypothetical protein OXJ53_10485 [Gammaproteobacteria bacterium]|nr:hypothetical protein [Gammaproteobacteria bacterium]MDE0271594.1 hypothetical protein [Gammaproteobacteria bacterium]
MVGLLALASGAGACVIDVGVANWWVEKHGAVQKVRLEGAVLDARPEAVVKAWVRTRLHYERSDGWTGTLRSLDNLWVNTDHSISGGGLVTVRAPLCDEVRPCWLNDVEVYEVECFD